MGRPPPHGEAKNKLLQLWWKHAQTLIQLAGIWGDSNPKVWERFVPVVISNEAKSAWGGLPMGRLPMGRGGGRKNKLLQLRCEHGKKLIEPAGTWGTLTPKFGNDSPSGSCETFEKRMGRPPHGEAPHGEGKGKNKILQLKWEHAKKLIQPAGTWGDSSPKVWERFSKWFVWNIRKAHGGLPRLPMGRPKINFCNSHAINVQLSGNMVPVGPHVLHFSVHEKRLWKKSYSHCSWKLSFSYRNNFFQNFC